MDNNKFIEFCKDEISRIHIGVLRESIFVVWTCKTLQNNKAILSFSKKGAPLIEMTHDGDKGVVYMDIYEKAVNFVLQVKENE